MTPSQRRLRARLGALALHSRYDSHEIAARARRGFLAKFEREVDPDGALPPAEREARARRALRAHMTRMAMASARKRGRKRAAVATA